MKIIEAVTALVSALAWPLFLVFLLLLVNSKYSKAILDCLGRIHDVKISAGGMQVGINMQQVVDSLVQAEAVKAQKGAAPVVISTPTPSGAPATETAGDTPGAETAGRAETAGETPDGGEGGATANGAAPPPAAAMRVSAPPPTLAYMTAPTAPVMLMATPQGIPSQAGYDISGMAGAIASALQVLSQSGKLAKAAKARILWVDENPGDSFVEKQAIRAIGTTIINATSAEKAKALVATSGSSTAPRFDVVISDVLLGGDATGGLKLREELRTKGYKAPVVFYTSRANAGRDDVKEAAAKVGARVYWRPTELFKGLVDMLLGAATVV